MPNLPIIVTPSAEKDMQEIFDFIAADNKNKAIEIIDKFEKHYQIIYSLKDDTLYILRVLTGYKDYFHC